MSLPPLRQQVLRKIPGVDEILQWPELSVFLDAHPRPVVVEGVRRALGRLRDELLLKEDLSETDETLFSPEGLLTRIGREIALQVCPRLRPVINATGVVIHTNLGRSPLHPFALEQMVEVAWGYSNLEFDLETGERGSRYSHIEETLCRLTGAEAAMAVNNNAGAVLLCLSALASGKEVVVSRGELVEIGGAFRIPDVMRWSGAKLVEVGTTNRTRASDYEKAVTGETGALLKVHPSNFRVLGFTSEVTLTELAALGKKHGVPVINDLGSGCLLDLSPYGLPGEPTVRDSLAAGADVVTVSGDKLLGGPQAGILLGKTIHIDRIKTHPLTRALRIDKLTLAALEATLLLYLDPEQALAEIPTLRMLTTGRDVLRNRGRRLLQRLRKLGTGKATFTLREDRSQVGGGSLPLQELPTFVVAVVPEGLSVNALEKRLREGELPVVGRISRGELLLDVRTVFDEEVPLLGERIERALKGGAA
jgi:L-seryl-tRNA(Ser) seleniumtransferase